jgi:hypothetical protein
MPIQLSPAVRNNMLESYECGVNGHTVAGGTGSGGSVTGTAAAPRVRILSGGIPANTAAAETGTLGVQMNLPADWAAAASAGAKAISGTWQGTASNNITAGYYRIVDNAGTTCHEQGTAGQQVNLTTNALTAVNGNVLNFAATTGAVVGMNVAGTGVPADTTVVAVTATTVTMSRTSTAGVANTTAIQFTPDLVLDNASINSGQTVTITSKTLTAPNA